MCKENIMFLEELMLLFHIRTCKIECGLHCDGISTLTHGTVGNLQFWSIFLISVVHSLHSFLVCNCALVVVFLIHLPVRCCNITRVWHATLCFCISNRTATVRKKCPTHLFYVPLSAQWIAVWNNVFPYATYNCVFKAKLDICDNDRHKNWGFIQFVFHT